MEAILQKNQFLKALTHVQNVVERRNTIPILANILIIADPYKSRPYYKVARVKAASGKKSFSYDMTPNSPEPSIDWRDSNSTKKVLKPLVKVSVPPRMPKSKNRFFAFIKSVLTLSIFFVLFKSKKKKNAKKRRNRNYKKNQPRVNRGNKNQITEIPEPITKEKTQTPRM